MTQNDTTPNASVTPEQLDTLKRMIGLLTKRQDHLEGEIRRIDGVSRAAHNRLDALKQTVDAVAPDLATAVTSLVQLMDQLHVQVEPTDNAEEDDDQQPAEPTQDEQPTPSPAVAAPVETGQQPAEQTEAELLEEMRRFSQGS